MGKYKGIFKMDDKCIICDFENLYKAYRKAKSGKSHNNSCAKFQIMDLDGVHMLKGQLESQTYKMNKYNEFTIYEPKERLIKSCSFKDKVVQHCLADNILHQELVKEFIECNYAGQVGKGTHFGMDKLKSHMISFYEHNGIDGWILKCDISKFFYSIDHEVLKDIVDYHFENEYTIWLNHLFIDSTDGIGLPLGNQVAQIYALLFLNGLDHMITGELGITLYGRYMDDFYLIHHDKEYLKYCKLAIESMVSSLNLSLNGKTQLIPFKDGIRFIGFHHYITPDGKYIRKLCGDNKRKIKKRLRKNARLVKSGKMSRDDFMKRYDSWKNHASHGNCIKLCRSMDCFVEELLKEREE